MPIIQATRTTLHRFESRDYSVYEGDDFLLSELEDRQRKRIMENILNA